MKNLFTLFVILFALLQFAFAQPKPQDTSDIIWQKYLGASKPCGDAKFSADGNTIYANINSQIFKLSAKTGDSIGMFDGTAAMYVMDYAGGKYIATITGALGANIWDVQQEKLIKSMQYGNDVIGFPSGISISPDDRFVLIGLASDSGQNIVVYDPNIDKELTRFQCKGNPLAIKFSHDGTKFAICSYYTDQLTQITHTSVTIWETETRKQIKELYNTLNFSPDVYIKFSYDDKMFAITFNVGKFTEIFDINLNKIINSSDLVQQCFYMDFYPDNNHCFFYYGKDNGYHSFEYYNLNNGKTDHKYIIYDGGIDCNINTNQVIINGWYWLTLLKPTITKVLDAGLIKEKLNIQGQSDTFTIELTTEHIGNAEVFISDLLGKNIYQQSLGLVIQGLNRFSINVNLPIGIYICKILINDYSISQKFQVGR